ncbi:ABC transporter ATP-binding protein [Halomonas sp. ISL-60]|uniref:ABC transporter ATP-binding protein n=1 Tax=Halomonas sp. ISL-56 TaxID=2819149 RepID=UPI001BEA7CE1|nr:ABC transporter ATP-binding protein [Halomonas sp. ISL-56]MBT2771837.1 ABC transporter ATP-binding protein [Halomonas sp. ISL-60]MBT2801621.1 ABC transporter ATP-binding protein [Halomonas sp. ISL-56]
MGWLGAGGHVADSRVAGSVAEPFQGLCVAVDQTGPIPLAAEFACHPGELLALVGPSGSGKTTLLRTIAGLYRPHSGRVACAGDVWFDAEGKHSLSPQRRQVGMVFQDYALFPHLTAAQNIQLPLRHLAQPQRREQAEQWLAKVRLEGLGERYPNALSGGQRQRVALARALAREPKVLLLDEPFSAVDQVTRRRLQRELALLRQQIDIPIVLVTHDLEEASALADQICVLHNGTSLQQGTPEALFNRPSSPLVARLLDRHNLFEGVIVEFEGERRLQWGETSLEVADGLNDLSLGESVTWYLPPSDIVLHRRDRPSQGERENPITATVSELVALGGITSVSLRASHGDMLRFDIATHAARRNQLTCGAVVNVSLLAAGIHLMRGHRVRADAHDKRK